MPLPQKTLAFAAKDAPAAKIVIKVVRSAISLLAALVQKGSPVQSGHGRHLIAAGKSHEIDARGERMHHGGNGALYPSRRDNGIRVEKYDIFGRFGYRAHIEEIFTSAAKQQGVHIFDRAALSFASAPYLAVFASAAHEHEYAFKPFRTFERPNDFFVIFLRLARAFGKVCEQNKRRVFFVVTAF